MRRVFHLGGESKLPGKPSTNTIRKSRILEGARNGHRSKIVHATNGNGRFGLAAGRSGRASRRVGRSGRRLSSPLPADARGESRASRRERHFKRNGVGARQFGGTNRRDENAASGPDSRMVRRH